MGDHKADRTGRILEFLTRKGRVEVDDLVVKLATSPATVRRELARLERQGMIKRDRGGASLSVPSMFEPFLDQVTFANQVHQMSAEKTRIGALAASLVKDAETVGLAPGTTTTQVARFLQRRSNLTIVTNAVNIAMELCRKRDFRINLTGGLISGDWFALIGAKALEAIPNIRMDYFFFGANGVTVENGVTDRHLEEAAINRAMLRYASKRVLVVDHHKFQNVAQCLVCPTSELHMIITDENAGDELVEPFAKLGVQVLRA
ncbi:MAG: DeoR/GlpR transcriptional regulator [Acidobacteriaceae bacterium]|nr:DeoR/GlpR transcriptional regulator [Acidobacteriaceae bacterium]